MEKRLVKKRAFMVKTGYLYFLWLLCIVNNTLMCMHNQNLDQYYNEKIYVPIVRLTHKINLCFHEALFPANQQVSQSKMSVRLCCEHIEKLAAIIANDFDVFQKMSQKQIFRNMKKNVSKRESDLITTQVLNQLQYPEKTATNDPSNLITNSLRKIQKKLVALNNIYEITSEQYYAHLRLIQQQYYTILGDQKALFEKKNYFKQKLLNDPVLCPSFLQGISTKTYKLSWVPFLDTKYVIKKIVTLNAGEDAYNELKKNSYFKAFRLLHKNNIIRLKTLVTSVHALLETRPARFMIDRTEGTHFREYFYNLQGYAFMELGENINRAHSNSLKMINKDKRFSFIKHESKINGKPQIQPNESSVWITDNIIGESIQPGIIDNVMSALGSIPTDLNIIKTSAQAMASSARSMAQSFVNSVPSVARSFVSSMVPWYEPQPLMLPTVAINNNPLSLPVNQSKPVQSEVVVMGNIQDLLMAVHLYPDVMSMHRQIAREPHVNALVKINFIHKELERNTIMQYGLYQARNKHLPETWSELSLKIDNLYNSLIQLKNARKKLGFFNIWGKIINSVERNNIKKSIDEHIDIYNKIKINIYTQNSPYHDMGSYQFNPDRTYAEDEHKNLYIASNPYGKIRTEFAENCAFSHADNIDLLKETTKNGSPYKKYAHVFNPLERAELRHCIE